MLEVSLEGTLYLLQRLLLKVGFDRCDLIDFIVIEAVFDGADVKHRYHFRIGFLFI